ncbi:hypothetical protein BDF19DRAFT_435255 [Syncephalis fuscata]|nr:hypothetical protein BDF19DRAFT_435255 [Syncephalis fuscata]
MNQTLNIFYRIKNLVPECQVTCPDRRYAVLISGASSGIGRDATECLAEAGFTVFAGARTQLGLDALANIEGVIPIRLEIRSSDDVKNACKAVQLWRNGFDGRYLVAIVNNAAYYLESTTEEAAGSQMRDIFNVLVFGAVDLSAALLPQLRETAQAGEVTPRLINITSSAIFSSAPIVSVYGSAKLAMTRLNDSMRIELYEQGIRVINIVPSNIKTPLHNKTLCTEKESLDSGKKQYYSAIYRAHNKRSKKKSRSSISAAFVSKAIIMAICSSRPKRRYFVGSNSAKSYWQYKLLPTSVQDWILRCIFLDSNVKSKKIVKKSKSTKDHQSQGFHFINRHSQSAMNNCLNTRFNAIQGSAKMHYT